MVNEKSLSDSPYYEYLIHVIRILKAQLYSIYPLHPNGYLFIYHATNDWHLPESVHDTFQ